MAASSRLSTPTDGAIRLREVDLSDLSDDERTELRSDQIGFVFQRFNLVPVLNAVENVGLPLVIARTPATEVRTRAMEVLELVGLSDRADHRPAELSGGEQQRVAMARALVLEPTVVLADEPTGSLDSTTGSALLDLLTSLQEKRGLTIVLVTHDARVAATATELCTMRDGRIVDQQPLRPNSWTASRALADLLVDDEAG